METQVALLLPYFYGFATTLALWICSCLISMVVGTAVGLLVSDQYHVTGLSGLASGFVLVFQGVPFFVQMYIAYFALPDLTGINFSPFWTGAVSLGVCSSAYMAQIVRSGIESIHRGQFEACRALGYTTGQSARHIILPNVLVRMLPSITSEINAVLKTTSVISAIGVSELTRVGFSSIYKDLNPVPVYLGISLAYLAMGWMVSLVSMGLRRRLTKCGRFSG